MALAHSFFSGYHDRDDEPSCQAPFDFRFEATVTKDDVSKEVADVIDQYQARKARSVQANPTSFASAKRFCVTSI